MKKIFETSLFFGLNWPSENGGSSEVKEIKKSPEQQKQEDIDRLNRLLDLTKKAVEQGVLTQEQADNNIAQYKKMLNQLEWKNTVENNNLNSENKENNTEKNIWNSENANQEISENQGFENIDDLRNNNIKELKETALAEMWKKWTDSEYFFQKFLIENNLNDKILYTKNHDERRQILDKATNYIANSIIEEWEIIADGWTPERPNLTKIKWVDIKDFLQKDTGFFSDIDIMGKLFNKWKVDISEKNREELQKILWKSNPEIITIAKKAEKIEAIEESNLLLELVKNKDNLSQDDFRSKLRDIFQKITQKEQDDKNLQKYKNTKKPKDWIDSQNSYIKAYKNLKQPSVDFNVNNSISNSKNLEKQEQNIENVKEAKIAEQDKIKVIEEVQKVTEKSWESKDSIQNVAKAIENMDAETIKKAVSGNEKAENLVIEDNSNPDANKVIETLVTGGALEYKVPNSDHPVLVRIDKNSAKLWIEYKWEFFKSNPKAIGNSYVKMFQEMASNPIFESMLSAGYSRGFKHLEQKFNSSNSTEVLGDKPNNFYRIILKELANISGFDAFNKIQSDTQIKEFNSHMQNPQNWELVRKQFETIEPPLITIDWKMRTDTWAERSSKKEELQTANIELDLWYNYLYP